MMPNKTGWWPVQFRYAKPAPGSVDPRWRDMCCGGGMWEYIPEEGEEGYVPMQSFVEEQGVKFTDRKCARAVVYYLNLLEGQLRRYSKMHKTRRPRMLYRVGPRRMQ